MRVDPAGVMSRVLVCDLRTKKKYTYRGRSTPRGRRVNQAEGGGREEWLESEHDWRIGLAEKKPLYGFQDQELPTFDKAHEMLEARKSSPATARTPLPTRLLDRDDPHGDKVISRPHLASWRRNLSA